MGDLFLYRRLKITGSQKLTKHLCERRDVTDDILWVRDTLDVDCLGLFIDGGGEGFWSLLSDPLDTDPIMLERHLKIS